MRENELQEKAVVGGMTEKDWEEFYGKSEEEQDAFCRERLRKFGLSRSFERESYIFQYKDGDAPSFRKVVLLTENDEKFPFKADDFLGVFQNRLNLVDTLPREQFSQLLFK